MVVRNSTFNRSFQSTGKRVSPKALAIMRRADTERDSKGFAISGDRKRGTFIGGQVPSLPRVKFLEKPLDDE